jgi:hypothetical protein
MALRVARGLFRLWLVLSVLWIGGVAARDCAPTGSDGATVAVTTLASISTRVGPVRNAPENSILYSMRASTLFLNNTLFRNLNNGTGPPPRKRTRERPSARPQGDCAATTRRASGERPRAVGVVADTSDWSAGAMLAPQRD